MTIKEQIKEKLREAMISHDDISKNTLKGALSALTNELVATGRTPRDELTEEETLKVLKRLQKQRKDAIGKYQSAEREDLVAIEEEELKVLSEFLPKEMNDDDIRKIALKKQTELSLEDPSKVGILIGAVMKETQGQADGSRVQKIIKDLF